MSFQLFVVGFLSSMIGIGLYAAGQRLFAVRCVNHGKGVRSAEETALMQELFRGMKKLEERLESLETILLEKGGGR